MKLQKAGKQAQNPPSRRKIKLRCSQVKLGTLIIGTALYDFRLILFHHGTLI
nr:MAG TPA: hypothetical protein [Caudoviricetes sp.]